MGIVNSAHSTFSGEKSIIGVVGTLGTSDIGGTALTLPVGVHAATGAQYVWLAGTDVNTTVQINPTSIPQMIQFGTLGTAGGSFFGTISAASGAGTKHYIQGVDIVVQSGTVDVRVLAGTSIQGTGVLAAGQFVPSAGISKQWWPHFNTGTNSELIYHFVGAGTAFITVSYWKGA